MRRVNIDATCPSCAAQLGEFRAVDDADRAPIDGAWAICVHCAEVLRFAQDDNGALVLRCTTLDERSGPEAPDNLDDALRVTLARLPRSRH